MKLKMTLKFPDVPISRAATKNYIENLFKSFN